MRRLLLILIILFWIAGLAGAQISIPKTDSGDAIVDTSLMLFLDGTNRTFTAQTATDVRAYMQQGISVDISGKLDTDLQNVDAALTDLEKAAFYAAIGIPSIAYQELSNEPFIVIEPGSDLPSASSSNARNLVIQGTGQGRIIYHQTLEHGDVLSVTYRDFNSSDLDTGTYRGAVYFPENLPVSTANEGDVYYVRSTENLRIFNATAMQFGDVAWGAGEYLGAYFTEGEADHAVGAHYPSGGTGTPVGKHIAYGDGPSRQLYTITAYTPATVSRRLWKPIFTGSSGDTADTIFINVPPGSNFPAATEENASFLMVAGTAQGRTIYHQEIRPGGTASVTTRFYNATGDIAGTGNTYRGAVDYPDDLPTSGQMEGDNYYVRSTQSLWRYSATSTIFTHQDWPAGEWLGAYGSEEDAERAIGSQFPTGSTGTPVGKTVAYRTIGVGVVLYKVTAYTGAAQAQRYWAPIIEQTPTVYRGTYNAHTEYGTGDIVVYENALWMALSNKPTTLPVARNTSPWLRLTHDRIEWRGAAVASPMSIDYNPGDVLTVGSGVYMAKSAVGSNAGAIPTSTSFWRLDGSGTVIAAADTPDSYGTTGQVLKVNADADGFVFADDTGGTGTGVTRANVYAQVKDIIVDGTNITTTDDDTAETVTIASTGGTGTTPPTLTEMQAEDPDDTNAGLVTGERLFGAVNAYISRSAYETGETYQTGEIVTRGDVHWFSLEDDNNFIPTAAQDTWFPMPGGGTLRGNAPTAQTDYEPLQIVIAGNTAYYTTAAAENVAASDIPSHASFSPLVHYLEGIDLALSGSALTITADRVGLADLTDTVTLPSGGTGVSAYADLTGEPFVVVPDGTARVAASDSNIGQFLIDFNVGRIYHNVLHPGHGASATWRDMTNADLRSVTGETDINYRGVVAHFTALPDSPANHDVYYIRASDSFMRYAVNVWVDFAVDELLQGYYVTESECTHALGVAVGSGTGTGLICAYDTQNVLREQALPRFSTAYTAPEADTRQWVDWQSGIIAQLGRKVQVVGDPTNGQVPVWNSTASQWQPGDAATGGDAGFTLEEAATATIDITSIAVVHRVSESWTIPEDTLLFLEVTGAATNQGNTGIFVPSNILRDLDSAGANAATINTTPWTNAQDKARIYGLPRIFPGTSIGGNTADVKLVRDDDYRLYIGSANVSDDFSPVTVYTVNIGGGGAAADGVADSVDLALSGNDLSITIGLTEGNDLTDSVTLPDSASGEANVQANWTQTDTADDSFILNKPCVVTAAVEAGQGACLVAVSAGDIRYHRKGGDDVPVADGGTGASDAVMARSNLGLGTAATHNVGTTDGFLVELETDGNFHPRRLANNSPDALTTDVQFLRNNSTTTARWADLDGYVNDFAGTLLATLTEFSYDDSNDTLTFTAGSGGTTVSANPGGSGLTDLVTVTIGDTSYDVGDTTAFNAVSASNANGLAFTERGGGTETVTAAELRTTIGTGTANMTTYLRGDGSWQPISSISITGSDHYQGDYDSTRTDYVQGDVVAHNDAFWVVNNATLANANEPALPVETTGWLEISDESGFRGAFDDDDDTDYTFHTGDTLTIPGEGFFFCLSGGDYAPEDIPNSASWTIFLHQSAVTNGNIRSAISGGDPPDDGFIVNDGAPENRLEWRTLNEVRTLVGAEIYVESGDITYDDNNTQRRISFDVDDKTRSNEGETYLFVYGDNDFSPATQEIRVRIGSEIALPVRWVDSTGTIDEVTLGDLTQNSVYELYRASSVFHMIARTVNEIPDVTALPASAITSGILNTARLSAGGSDNDVLTRTATGMAWETPSVGLTQTTADSRYLRIDTAAPNNQIVRDDLRIESSSGGVLVVDGQNAGGSTVFSVKVPTGNSGKAFGASRDGETTDFMQFRLSGGNPAIEFGPGSSGRDTNLFRSAANTLRTDDSFQVGGGLTVSGTAVNFADNSINGQDITHNTVGTDELELNAVRLDEMAHRSGDAGDVIGYSSTGEPEAKRPDFLIPAQSTAPASAPEGAMYVDTDPDPPELMIYDGSDWNEVGGGDTFSAVAERDISWNNIGNDEIILTNITPPSDTKVIVVSSRLDNVDIWLPTVHVPYATWNNFTAVAADNTVTNANRSTFLPHISVRLFVAKGTSGVLGFGVDTNSNSAANRFDKVRVWFVT